ncbi:NS1-like protein [Dinothrombium tinctorium]|uniref:NS1-like protein n=1 Tax=Dinothrombium tinctorium TaxID=1965070 RepID=A0A443Q9D7_9ACAR|nr:NS1-like protein [Dinothrombium tinctorium]
MSSDEEKSEDVNLFKPYYMCLFSVPENTSMNDSFKGARQSGKNFILVYHDPSITPEIPSEYFKQHYHLLLGCEKSKFYNDSTWNKLKDEIKFRGGWFKSAKVFSIGSTCAYFQMPGKTIIDCLQGMLAKLYKSVTKEQIETQIMKKLKKNDVSKETNDDINLIRNWIFEYNAWTETELIGKLHYEPAFLTIYKKFSFSKNFEKAKVLASQKVINMRFEELIEMWEETKIQNNFLSESESTDVMLQWCSLQEINPNEFANTIISFINKSLCKINTLWFHGQSNAGKSYIVRSIANLCQLYHQIPPGSNRFMWQDAVNKRLIIMTEPVLDEVAIEGCKEVFEGTGCYVPVKMKSDQFLAPTPVIITSNTYLWAYNPR